MVGHFLKATTLGEAQTAAPIFAEFVGSFALIFAVGCLKICGDAACASMGIACVLSALIYALAPVSASLRTKCKDDKAAPVLTPGVHLNPAVTLVSACLGNMSLMRAFVYLVVQFLGAVLAGVACESVFHVNKPATTELHMNLAEIGFVEAVYTGLLCFVFLNCWGSLKNNPQDNGNQFYGLAMGFVYVAGGYSTARISGAHFNPAISMALDFSYGMSFEWRLKYVAFQLSGAAGAVLAYSLCRRSEFAAQTPVQKLGSRALTEFLGAFIVALTYGLSALSQSDAGAYATGAALTCMCFSLGHVSGAHFNPAVTLSVVLADRARNLQSWQLKFLDGVAYVASQLTGGLLAGLVIANMYTASRQTDVKIVLGPHDNFTQSQINTLEFAYTSVLCFVVLAVATVQSFNQEFAALAIGSCVIGGGLSMGSITGGFLNPAVTLAMGTAKYIVLGYGLDTCGSYMLFQLLAGVFASSMFMLTHPEELEKDLFFH